MSESTRVDIPTAVVEVVSRVVADAPAERRAHEVLAALRALPGIEEISRLVLHHQEYVIEVGMTGHLARRAEVLNSVRDWKLWSAPEVVALLQVSDEDSVLVTRYQACSGERLVPVRSIETKFGVQARDRFRKDMQTLFEHSVFHPYAHRGFHHWWMGERSGTLVLDSWSALRSCTPQEAAEALDRIDSKLEEGNEFPTP